MAAAEEGIVLDLLEVQAGSRSDTRGVLRMQDETGVAVYAGSQDLQLQVRIGAHAVPEETLRALVEEGLRCSPVPTAVRNGTPLAVRVEIAQVRLEAG